MINIAMADDHVLYLKGLSALISSHPNFTVCIEAYNGKDLIDQILLKKERIDICLLDVKMPEMDGYETLVELRKTFPTIKTLIISMHNHEHVIINMLKNGANGFITKDFYPEELFVALQSICQKGYHYGDTFSEYFSRVNSIPTFTQQEYQFIKLCCEELTYKEISEKMFLSPRTIENYRETVFKKLGVQNRIGVVIYAMQNGLI
jgi:DNA-binding NarL/FixJ family response regulator